MSHELQLVYQAQRDRWSTTTTGVNHIGCSLMYHSFKTWSWDDILLFRFSKLGLHLPRCIVMYVCIYNTATIFVHQ
jgi:hypothetical protein